MKILAIVLLLTLISFANAAKILALLPFQMRSHNMVFQKYVDGLHARGHELVVVSPFPPTRRDLQNYTHIDTASIVRNNTDSLSINRENASGSVFRHFSFMHNFEFEHCHRILANSDVRNLYTNDEHRFDAVIVQSYYVHCYLPIGVVKNAPIVWFLAPSRMFAADLAIGNVQNPAYLPSLLRKYEFPFSNTSSTTFFARLKNSVLYVLVNVYHYFHFAPLTRRICEEYFGLERMSCDVNDLFKSVSLLLTYSHSALHPRPTVPNHVQIGGLHIAPASPLPQDLQRFLDESTTDVVFVSFGSLVKMSVAEDRLIDALLEAFVACDCRILWRSDLDETNSTRIIPENVLARKWFPQRDILAHKKVKAFVSHGGLYGIYEAIYTGTPVIGIPLFFDQFDNVRRIEELGVGIHLSYDQIFTDLKIVIRDILNNTKYSENMHRFSKILQDEDASPLEKAIYWTEYVIRHKGAVHLRSSSVDLPFLQYLLLDVLGVIVLFPLIIVYLLQKLIRLAIRITGRPKAFPHKNRIRKVR